MHAEISERLSLMSRHGDIPHLLFHGPRGSGKMSLVKHLLYKLYGPGVNHVASEKRVVDTLSSASPSSSAVSSSQSKIEIDVRVSNYHIEIEPSAAGSKDTFVVQQTIKEMAANGSIAAVLMDSAVTHKTIVLRGAGDISKQAQAGLRRTMETLSGSCRLILVSTFCSRVIEPLRSRCVCIRVPLPSPTNLAVAVRSQLGNGGQEGLAEDIVLRSGRSISRAMHMAREGNNDEVKWVQYIDFVCTGVFLEQSPRKLMDVRESLNELLAAGVSATIILKTLVHKLVEHEALRDADAEKIKAEIVEWAADYEHRLSVGSRPILHLEAFVACFMDLFKKFTVNQFL